MPETYEQRQQLRDEMATMTASLVAEFAGRVAPVRVTSAVARCRDHLLHTGLRAGLVPATEAAARRQLHATLPARPCS